MWRKNFRENYLLTDGFEFLPEGMVSMCYPADHNNGMFIPNWAMFFVVELEEYLQRSNDREMVDALKPRVMGIINYFSKFLNEDGLLESLESWVFVEWSNANDFLQDVSYPTNMLYTSVLQSAADLYDMPELAVQAKKMRQTIKKQSFNGTFFVDHAVRENGKLVVQNDITEVCQYYAFFFGGYEFNEFPELWKTLVNDFGPKRKVNNPYPKVHFANALLGMPMRFNLLAKDNKEQQILEECVDYYTPMYEKTGTLWEHDGTHASCNHGFASQICHVFYRDVLGLSVDIISKTVSVKFSDLDIEYCKGQMPVGNDIVALDWKKKGNTIEYKLELPKGYKAKIVNHTGKKLVKK